MAVYRVIMKAGKQIPAQLRSDPTFHHYGSPSRTYAQWDATSEVDDEGNLIYLVTIADPFWTPIFVSRIQHEDTVIDYWNMGKLARVKEAV